MKNSIGKNNAMTIGNSLSPIVDNFFMETKGKLLVLSILINCIDSNIITAVCRKGILNP